MEGAGRLSLKMRSRRCEWDWSPTELAWTQGRDSYGWGGGSLEIGWERNQLERFQGDRGGSLAGVTQVSKNPFLP